MGVEWGICMSGDEEEWQRLEKGRDPSNEQLEEGHRSLQAIRHKSRPVDLERGKSGRIQPQDAKRVKTRSGFPQSAGNCVNTDTL